MSLYVVEQRSNDGCEGIVGVYSSIDNALEGAKACIRRPEESYSWYTYHVLEMDLDKTPLPEGLSANGSIPEKEVAWVEYHPRTFTIEVTYGDIK